MGMLSNLFLRSPQYSLPIFLNIISAQTGTMILYLACGSACFMSLTGAVQADEREGLLFFCSQKLEHSAEFRESE